MLAATPDAIVGVDVDGRIAMANRSCTELFGYDQSELTGMAAWRLFAPEIREEMAALRARLQRDPRLRAANRKLTAWLQRKDGSRFPGEIMLSWLDDSAGSLMIAATRDLTELRRAESRFQALLEAAPDAIVGVARDGRVLLMNAAAERLLGYPRGALVGTAYDILIPPHLHEPVRLDVERAFDAAEPGFVIQTDVRHADGTVFPTESVVTRFADGPQDILLSSIRDMRPWRAAEQERQHLAEEVERRKVDQVVERAQRMEALGQLAGGVAHDFNNLLAVIINYTSLIGEELSELRDLPADRQAQLREDIGRVKNAAEGGAALTQQLLAFGRQDVARPRVLSVNAVVEDLAHLLRTSIGEHVALRLRFADDVWPVLMDRSQIEQVVTNLAVNARDAMPSGGELRIETGNHTVGEDEGVALGVEPGRYVRLRVIDTGDGMPAEVRARAFEPFYTTKPKGRGTGLGLAMVYGVVTQAAGTVTLRSEPGAGTEVEILLPVTDEPATRVEPGARRARRGRQETVLVAEDEDGIRDAVTRVLGRQGYQVLAAADGPAAVELARNHPDPIDLLLTDVIMPGMLGRTLAELVTALVPGVPVVFMSGYAQPLLAADGTVDGEVLLLEKPFTPAALLDRVQSALDARHIPA